MKVAVLDDYQNVALELADWSSVRRHAEITVFSDHVSDPSTVVERLRPFNAVCVMRERTRLREIPATTERVEKPTGPRNIYRHPGRGRSRHRGHRDGLHSTRPSSYLVADPGEHAGASTAGRLAEGRRMADRPR